MTVRIPTPLQSYTGAAAVEARGGTVDAVLAELDRRFPGIRFRMIDEQGVVRPHIRVFVNGRQVRDLSTAVSGPDELQILQALSGGV